MKQIKLKLDKDIYPIEAILSACYFFIDRLYFFLDTDSKGKKIEVSIKPKKVNNNFKTAVDQFKNELVNASLRCKISSSNKKIREYIIGSALYSNDLLISPEKLNYQDDPLGIAKPWEQKHKKKSDKTKIQSKNL